jgi:hypothetical protein
MDLDVPPAPSVLAMYLSSLLHAWLVLGPVIYTGSTASSQVPHACMRIYML